ncbi:MAG: metalloregulator ArsR/SmtB family transcription factor [Halobacteria archaeon]|nr:metalloregulator ArsR/SmtB family transcription factor [Halobacteria archaeon]
MTTEERLERLIADEVGECCEGDIEERVETLEMLKARTPNNVSDDVKLFKVMASETRYRIVRLLIEAEDELCVCELAPLFDVSESAVSHALSDLTEVGLVSDD